MTDAVRAALERIAALHPDTDSSEGMNEWGEAECFSKAQQIADAALAGKAQSEEMSPEFTDTARDALLWVLWHHQGGSSPIGQPIRFALGMGAHERLSEPQINRAKRWASLTKSTTDDFHRAHPAPVERVALSDEQIDRVYKDAFTTLVARGWSTHTVTWQRAAARAVIAEYERANGIGKGGAV